MATVRAHVTLPKPQTVCRQTEGRFGSRLFAYVPEGRTPIAPAGSCFLIARQRRRQQDAGGGTGTQQSKIVRSNPQCPTVPSGGFCDVSMSILSRGCAACGIDEWVENLTSHAPASRDSRDPFGAMKARMGDTLPTKTLQSSRLDGSLALAYNLPLVHEHRRYQVAGWLRSCGLNRTWSWLRADVLEGRFFTRPRPNQTSISTRRPTRYIGGHAGVPRPGKPERWAKKCSEVVMVRSSCARGNPCQSAFSEAATAALLVVSTAMC